MSVFGPRIGSYDVEQAVVALLRARLPTYVDHCARLKGIDPDVTGFPIRPRSLITAKDFRDWPEARLPCVQVVCPGMADQPVRDTDGYRASWQVNVFVVVSARDRPATRQLRSVWEDAIGWCVMQNRSLGGIATAVDWLGESSSDVPIEDGDERTLQGTVCVFSVEIPDVLDPNAGPAIFIPDPGSGTPPVYPDDPQATQVVVDYTPEELP
jgi:hypothetical protein